MPHRDGGLARVRLDFGYDGTDFSGWATQPGRRTVQGVLTEVLAVHGPGGRPPAKLVVAGRTDAGVHAANQVAHLEVEPATDDPLSTADPSYPQPPRTTPFGRPKTDSLESGGPRAGAAKSGNVRSPVEPNDLDRLVGRWNRMLPPDIRVFGARWVPPDFDARFSALRRHYAYRVADNPFGVRPLQRRDTLGWFRPLDVDALNEASARLLGEHDFLAFCRQRVGATTIRELQRLDWTRLPDGVLEARVSADAFCHSMVRSLIGALLAVGEGRLPVDWPASLLRATTRPSTVAVAPPHGLTLLGVDYPPDEELAARAARTRNLRQLQVDEA